MFVDFIYFDNEVCMSWCSYLLLAYCLFVACLFGIPLLCFVSLTCYQGRVRDSYLTRDVFSLTPGHPGTYLLNPFR